MKCVRKASGTAMVSKLLRMHRRPAQSDRRMGRFSHEAAAVDPATGYVYLTEDLRNASVFIGSFRGHERRGRSLEAGGRPSGAKVAARQREPDRRQRCDEYTLEWFDIANPDQDASAVGGPPLPGFDLSARGSGPFSQAWAAGGLQLARGEGLWCSGGKMYTVDTATGVDAINRSGRGNGALWELDLTTMKLKAIFVSGIKASATIRTRHRQPRGWSCCARRGCVADAYGTERACSGSPRRATRSFSARTMSI